MELKKEYESPIITIVSLEECDVLTASVGSDNGFDGEVDNSWW